jgi:monothiol glutaredoxin
MDAVLKDRMQQLVDRHAVVLFMKGNKAMPQCGFSAAAVEALRKAGTDFETVDVLRDPEVRTGMKEFSNWPTFPQCYIKGKFVGGSDILKQMLDSGELKKLVAPAP